MQFHSVLATLLPANSTDSVETISVLRECAQEDLSCLVVGSRNNRIVLLILHILSYFAKRE